MIWHKIPKTDLKDVEIQVINLKGKKVCLVRDGSNYYATASN
jgi:hypothetical protein